MPSRLLLGTVVLLLACADSNGVPGYSRQTGPDGRMIVTYASGLPAREDTLVPQVEIGKYVNDSSQIFGDLRDFAIDTAGVFWEGWSQRGSTPPPDRSTTGVVEGSSRPMFMTFDPATGARDSVIGFGPMTFRSFVASYANGQSVMGLPFASRAFITMDRHRRVWVGSTERYDLTRITMTTDTTLELHVAEAGLPLTDTDVVKWKESLAGMAKRIPDLVSRLTPYLPKTKPLMTELFTDDSDRLWIGRTVPLGAPARWDTFSSDGEFLATVRGPANVSGYLQPLVHGDRIYLMVEGEAGERYIAVAPLPGSLKAGKPAPES